mgnify:CR=1 FL=1
MLSNKLRSVTSFSYEFFLDAVTSSGILKAKQKLGVTFNFDKQDVIDLTKFSKMTQKQIQKNSRRSFVFWAKNYKGLFFLSVS